MHRGTFTTKGILKKLNRELEILLRDAELVCSIASIEGYVYPSEKLTKAWKKLLVNQFHDILPGTHIPPVTKDALKDYSEIRENINIIIKEAVIFLKIMNVSGENSNNKKYKLLNTLSWNCGGAIFVKGDFENNSRVDDFPSQNGKSRGEYVIPVDIDKINSLSSKTVTIREDKKVKNKEEWESFEGNILNTPFYKVVFEDDGSIKSLISKKKYKEIVGRNDVINKIKIYRDNPCMYYAWDILPNYKDREEKLELLDKIRKFKRGEVFVSFIVKHKN